MLNLFLAILLGNFDKARTFWLKKSIFEMFETAIEKKYSLSKAISIILGDVNKSVKEELLIHNERDIFKLNGRLMIINRELMENDPEEIEKLAYYDRLCTYETDYKPIIEVYSEEDKEEIEEKMESEHFSKHRKSDHHNDLERIEEEDEYKEHLNESKEGLVSQKKNSQTVLINRPGEEIAMRIRPPSKKQKYQDSSISNQFQADDDQEEMKFVTLETPREKVDDLEENSKENSKLLENRKIKKSTTFDLRDQHRQKEEEESEEHNLSSQEEENVPDEFHDHPDEEMDKAENHILVSNNEKPLWKKVLTHMANSSLFIFHKDWRFRKFLIDLVVSPENILEYENKKREEAMFNSNPDNKNDNFNKDFEHQNTLRNQPSFTHQQSMRFQVDYDKSFKRSKTGYQTNEDFYGNPNLARTEAKEIAENATKKR